MIKRLFILYFIICGHYSNAQTYTKTQILQDFQQLNDYLRHQHPGFGYYNTPERYKFVCDSVISAMPESLCLNQAYSLLLPVVNDVKCGHTSLRIPDPERKKTKNFPFYLKPLDNRYYIYCNLTSDTLLDRGTELLAINHISVDSVIKKLMFLKNNGIDNINYTARFNKTVNNIERMHYVLFGFADSVLLKYRSIKDNKIHLKYYRTISTAREQSIYAKKYGFENSDTKNLTLSIPDSLNKNVAIIDVSSFSNSKFDVLGFKYRRRLKNDFKKIKKQNIPNLVIDLRGDGGGRIGNADYLMTFIAKEKFNLTKKVEIRNGSFKAMPFPLNFVFKRFLFKKQDSVFYAQKRIGKIKPNKKWHYDGEVVLLMNSGSYSATTLFASVAQSKGLVKIAGDAPGGAYQVTFAGFFKFVKLKNTKMIARFPILRIQQDVNDVSKPHINIDIPVNRDIKDILTAGDPAMKAVLDYLKSNKTPKASIK